MNRLNESTLLSNFVWRCFILNDLFFQIIMKECKILLELMLVGRRVVSLCIDFHMKTQLSGLLFQILVHSFSIVSIFQLCLGPKPGLYFV